MEAGNQWTLQRADAEPVPVETFTLDVSKQPKLIDVTDTQIYMPFATVGSKVGDAAPQKGTAPSRKEIRKLSSDQPKRYKDYRELLRKEKPDIAIVATPDHWHALPTIEAVKSGAHVYVEKPVCHTIDEGKAMVKAARESDRLIQVGLPEGPRVLVPHPTHHVGVVVAEVLPLGDAQASHGPFQFAGTDLAEPSVVVRRVHVGDDDLAHLATGARDEHDAATCLDRFGHRPTRPDRFVVGVRMDGHQGRHVVFDHVADASAELGAVLSSHP